MKHRVRSAVGLLALTAMVACTSRPEPRIEAGETMPAPSTVAPEATTSSTPPATTKPKPLRPLGSLTFNRAFTPEEQAIAEAYADAEWWARIAQSEPANPDLSEFVESHGPELRDARVAAIARNVAERKTVSPPTVFRIRLFDLFHPNATKVNLSACMTQDEVISDAAGGRVTDGRYSIALTAAMDLVDGRWILTGSHSQKQVKDADQCVF